MIHLHVHSTYSMLDGFGTPEQYVDRLMSIGQKAMALTDHGNIYGHRQFVSAFGSAGIKFIPGCEFYVRNNKEKYNHITVLASDETGYRNLCTLVSLGNRPDHFQKKPLVSLSEIRAYRKGLVILSGCFGDGIPHRAYQKDRELVFAKIAAMKRMFSDIPFYLEIQHIDDEEREFMRCAAGIAKVKLCPTIDTHYPRKEDYQTEDLMLCIGTHDKMGNSKRFRLPSNIWLMSEEETLENGFTREEIRTTEEIGEICNVQLPSVKPLRLDGDRKMLVEMVRSGARRLGYSIKNDTYRKRYLYEMATIDTLGLHSYFVIMGDVIKFFKNRGVFVGPARGSSAGSLIAYLVGITEIDPIANGLSFERFLDINRKDYPDIDTDFPHDQRENVIEYLKAKYGAEQVGRLCSFVTYRGSSVFWDIARVYGVDSTVARNLGKAVPHLVNDEMDLCAIMDLPEVKRIVNNWPLFQKAVDLDGQVRQLGKHASGFAVSPVPLTELCAENLLGGETVLSVDKYMAEAAGLLKLDILGLTTLDITEKIMADMGIKNETIYRLKPDDCAVYDRFNCGDVAGVFQFDGGAVRRALSQFKVANLDDLAFINAIARPGASLALDSASFIPECLKQFCYKRKYFVYQEELMTILRFIGFSWEDVTRFRKLVSRKSVTEMEKVYHAPFVDSLSKHCGKNDAERFWLTVLRTGSYSFNKSHAVSYAFLAYVCMWLKINCPGPFVKHYLNGTSSDGKRRAVLREYLKSGWRIQIGGENAGIGFGVTGQNIVGGLCSLKGIGIAKANKYISGKTDKAIEKALAGAKDFPEIYAPWACLDDFANRYKIGDLPEGEFLLTARAWEIKDNHCVLEDKNGAEKAYFEPKYVKLNEGSVYRFAISKFKYAKIDRATCITSERTHCESQSGPPRKTPKH